MAVLIDKLFGYPGIRLYKDKELVDEIEAIDVIPVTTLVYILYRFTGERLHKIFRNTAGVFSLFTAYKRAGRKVILEAVQSDPLVCIPKSTLRIVQFNSKSSTAMPVYIRQLAEFKYSGFSITTLDPATGLPGCVYFSLSSTGTFTQSLQTQTLPTVVWVKTINTIKGKTYSLPLITTTKVYL